MYIYIYSVVLIRGLSAIRSAIHAMATLNRSAREKRYNYECVVHLPKSYRYSIGYVSVVEVIEATEEIIA